MTSSVQPGSWVGLKLPSENVRFLQIVPNTTISLGKYGSFPSNLIIQRPYHLTYELQDKLPGENYSRLRVIPPDELHADVLAEEEAAQSGGSEAPDYGEQDQGLSEQEGGVDAGMVEVELRNALSQEGNEPHRRQALTAQEIETLKREGTAAGRELIAKLLDSHMAIDQKTAFSLAKYKLLKTKKYIRRFMVLPLDVYTLGNWLLDDKDVGSKIMDLRHEMTALLGCWANAHYGGEDQFLEPPPPATDEAEGGGDDEKATADPAPQPQQAVRGSSSSYHQLPSIPMAANVSGRLLMVDDTGGYLVAAMAERMGILNDHKDAEDESTADPVDATTTTTTANTQKKISKHGDGAEQTNGHSCEKNERAEAETTLPRPGHPPVRRGRSDFHVPFSLTNNITLIHANSQPNLTYLKYFGFDSADPNHPPHPLGEHLLCLSWLQLLEPENDTVYSERPRHQPPDVVASWKPPRRGNYHRKRRRWARTRHIVDTARAGGFTGLVVSTSMNLVSTLRHTLPLLAGGAAVAVYSPSLEPLVQLADCFSVGRRAAWSGQDFPQDSEGKTTVQLEWWPGNEQFPLNPMLLLGVSVQTTRAKMWQVLPGRTHPVMTARGGPEGFVLTGWKAKPADGRVAARGKFGKRKTMDPL